MTSIICPQPLGFLRPENLRATRRVPNSTTKHSTQPCPAMPPTLEDDYSTCLYDGFSAPSQTSPYTPNLSNNPNTSNGGGGWYDNSTPTIEAPIPQSSSTRPKPAAPHNIEKLKLLPEVRSIPWKPGKQVEPVKSTESPRSQTRGAFMIVTRGQIRNPPCTNCESGTGRFSLCVPMNAWYHGACATCVLATRGTKCTLRQDMESML